MGRLDDCFSKGLLKKTSSEPQLAKKALKRAKDILLEIPRAIEADLLEMAQQRIYQAAFHGAKALLYRDGVKERSHYCVAVYLAEKYSGIFPSPFLTLLDELRDIRHELQYGLEVPAITKDELLEWSSQCEEMLKIIGKVLK